MSTTDSQHNATEKLRLDHKKISEAFAVLSEELPRLSNLDTNGVIHVLENLRTEVKNSIQIQRNFTDILDTRLIKLQESLDSLNKRLDSFESLPVAVVPRLDSRNDMYDSRNSVHDNIISTEKEEHTSYTRQAPPRHQPPSNQSLENNTSIFQGPSGALIIIIGSMIPILIALYWPDVFE